jgi:cytochrome c
VSRIVFLTAVAVVAPLISSASSAAAPPPAEMQSPPAFAQCKACHSVDAAGKSGVGPNLRGVGGQVSGTRPGYSYSPAMKAARKRWDRANLDAFLTNPGGVVAGTKMVAPGVADVQKRKQIVDYLLALKR